MERLGAVAAALLALVGAGSDAGSVLAARVHLVTPATVAPVGVAGRSEYGLEPGRYEVTGRCGGGNLGVSAFFRIVPRRSSFTVYLVRGEHVAPVRRVVAHTPAVARAALTALLRGPTAAEQRQGYTSAIPGSTSLRSVSLSHGVATVDLSGRFQAGGGSLSMLLRVAQVVHTATQFPTVSRVAFRLDGKPVEAIGGEGVIVSPPVGRADFEGQAPPILVEQPLPGDHVPLPPVVRGTANVFEAQFSVEVQTPDGKVLIRRSAHASAGTGIRGSFDICIPLRTTAKHLVLVAYDNSPKNGSRIDVVRVPITVGRTTSRSGARAALEKAPACARALAGDVGELRVAVAARENGVALHGVEGDLVETLEVRAAARGLEHR